jgi:hypothetical protein
VSKNNKYSFLGLLVLSTLLPKWIISEVYFNNSILVNTILNVEDIQYFPIVISFSEFIFNPSYYENLYQPNLLTFPIYGILFHFLFFKIFGIYTFFILELFFQFFFLIVFIKVIDKIFRDLNISLYFCFFIFLLISLFATILTYENVYYLGHLYNLLNENFGTRFPRPLFTGVVYFYFFYTLFYFDKNLEKFDLKYFLLLFFLLSVFLNSFFYYFFNFSILVFFLLLKNLKINIFKFLFENRNKIILVFVSFFILCLPFIVQLYFGEIDYSSRIGVIQIDLDQKLYLLRYYFFNLLRLESLFLIISAIIVHLYLNKKFLNLKEQISKINIFFYFLLVSIISPPIFFLASSKIVSIYHFLGILLFIKIFYLIISTSFIIYKKFNFGKKIKNKNLFKSILILLIFFLNINVERFTAEKDINKIKEIQKVQEFLENNNLIDSHKKLFTNDLKIMNLWLLNGNTQLTISDGFTNSLKNKEIELNFINNLKKFGTTSSEFETILSFGKGKMRDNLFMKLFIYRYQANSLYTYSDIDNYTVNLKHKIKNISPFRAQSQIVPENEKKRLIDLFNQTHLQHELYSEVVILNRSISLKNLIIHNPNYNLVYSNNIYQIYLYKK